MVFLTFFGHLSDFPRADVAIDIYISMCAAELKGLTDHLSLINSVS